MALYALDAIDDAIAATKAFLWPIERGTWLRLMIVVFFLGGSAFNPFQYNTSNTPPTRGDIPTNLPEITPEIIAIIALVIGAIFLIGLVFMFIGSIMEFVFTESLRHETVSLRKYWGENWRLGTRLFAFRLIIGLATLAIFAGLAVIALAPLILDQGSLSVGLIALAILIFIIISIVTGLITGFTTVFIVPIMLKHRLTVLAAWRRFWPTLTGQWQQYAVYAVLGFVLQLVAVLAAGIITIILAIALLIPFGLLGLLGAGALMLGSSIVGWIIIGIVAVLYVITLILIGLLIQVPIHTYLRYYALLVLGDTNDDFDLISERRTTIRD